jgi:hypothetical protein
MVQKTQRNIQRESEKNRKEKPKKIEKTKIKC